VAESKKRTSISDAIVQVLVSTNPANQKVLNTWIKEVLAKGNIVMFRNKRTGVVKLVNTWNPDELGDLKAFHTTGISLYVCPYAMEYEISEVIRPDISQICGET